MRKICCVLLICLFALTPCMVAATEPVSAPKGYFPEDLFRNAETCGQYFVNADCQDNQYEVIDGEYVLVLPNHKALDHMYTKNPIPYNKFTVSFDFLVQVASDGEGYDEMDFLFGVAEKGYPFHQAAMAGESDGSFCFIHHRYDGKWTRYDTDRIYYDFFSPGTWYEFAAEITPESVDIFINGEWIGALTDVMGCIEEYGRIGLRGGSAGGWKIKNLQVISDEIIEETPTPSEPVPSPTETVAPTLDPSALPEESANPTATQVPVASSDSSMMLPIVIAGVALLLGVGIGIGIVMVRKKK